MRRFSASKVRSYGESSRDSHKRSQRPSGAMRYTAPFAARTSTLDAAEDPEVGVSATAMAVTSVETVTVGTDARDEPPKESAPPDSVPEGTGGEPPDGLAPLTAATRRLPLS